MRLTQAVHEIASLGALAALLKRPLSARSAEGPVSLRQQLSEAAL
jgi:hypothetical protein